MRLFYGVGNAVRWVAGAIGNIVMTIIKAVVSVIESTVDAVATLTSRIFPGPQIAPPL